MADPDAQHGDGFPTPPLLQMHLSNSHSQDLSSLRKHIHQLSFIERRQCLLTKEMKNEAWGLRISLVRPYKLLGTQVIVQVFAIYTASLYGLMYLVLCSMPTLWEEEYGESVGIGFFLGNASRRGAPC